LRRLVKLARDCYQTGEQRDRKEGQAAPDVVRISLMVSGDFTRW
jgi:hypothetical protein